MQIHHNFFFFYVFSSVTSVQWCHHSWRKVMDFDANPKKRKFLFSHFKSSSALYSNILLFSLSQMPHSQTIWPAMETCRGWARGVWASRRWRERESRAVTPCRRSKSPWGVRLTPDHILTAAGGQTNTQPWAFSLSWGYGGLFRVSVCVSLSLSPLGFLRLWNKNVLVLWCVFFMCHSLLSVP